MSIFPHDEDPAVAVVRLGDPPAGAVEAVTRTWADAFGIPVDDRGRVPVPDALIDEPEPHSPGSYEDAVDEHVGEAYDFTVGVTDRGLEYWGSETYGTWDDEEGRAVLSTDRLVSAADADRWHDRFESLCRRIAGLLLGFGPHENCVMASASSPAAIDDTPASFCSDCTERLENEDTAPEPPDWQVVTRERAAAKRAERWEEGDVHRWEYPFYLAAEAVVGLFLLRDRLGGAPSLSVPRFARMVVHEAYRVGRFWWTVLSFLAAYVLVAGALLTFALGDEPSDVATWIVLAGSLPVAYVLSDLANTVVAGIVEGVVVGTREGLEE